MDSGLLDTALTAAGAVSLVFIGGWENARRARKTQERQDAADARAALEAQADELMAAVLALRVEGDAHDHLMGGWKARSLVVLRMATLGATAYGRTGRSDYPALMAGLGEAAAAVYRWNEHWTRSAAGLTSHLNRFGAATLPLLRHQDQSLAQATSELHTAISRHYADTGRTDRAIEDFQEALRAALEPPTPARRLRITRR
ncbi:hypothetical protein ACIPSE_46560 [Streptomyces sp. NPDC090106]|uniref:hypothetical protein n=1 Tax=Streptomyces sp. NPDC090106 TaxID=3365946 RepID=UPI003819C3A4